MAKMTKKLFEKKDKAADKKAGVKEGSKKDMMMDKKAGMPTFKRGGKVKGKGCGC